MNYTSTIIEESLANTSILNDVLILSTRISKVTVNSKTPWLTNWTLHKVEILENTVDQITYKLSQNLNKNNWYVDYKNNKFHYIVYRGKIFKIDLLNPDYAEAKKFGLSLGIPEYQLDFK